MQIPAALAFVVLLLPSSAPAQRCGSTIGRDEKVILTGDLGPCDGVAAAIVVDSGTLDLGGFTVGCADTNADGDLPQGIVLVGRHARVTNGRVVGCSNGIGLAGAGKHLVQGVTITGSADDGVDVAMGDKNRLVGNTSSNNGSDGIYLRTDRNKVSGNVTNGNAEDGIDVPSTGDHNRIVGHRAEGNADSGVEVGGTGNKIALAMANGNGGDGILLGGSRNKVRGGTSSGNGETDIQGCRGNSVKRLSFTTATSDCR
jgi:parallel beta-helix repeat protein